jgi:hypothetical protein
MAGRIVSINQPGGVITLPREWFKLERGKHDKIYN